MGLFVVNCERSVLQEMLSDVISKMHFVGDSQHKHLVISQLNHTFLTRRCLMTDIICLLQSSTISNLMT